MADLLKGYQSGSGEVVVSKAPVWDHPLLWTCLVGLLTIEWVAARQGARLSERQGGQIESGRTGAREGPGFTPVPAGPSHRRGGLCKTIRVIEAKTIPRTAMKINPLNSA